MLPENPHKKELSLTKHQINKTQGCILAERQFVLGLLGATCRAQSNDRPFKHRLPDGQHIRPSHGRLPVRGRFRWWLAVDLLHLRLTGPRVGFRLLRPHYQFTSHPSMHLTQRKRIHFGGD